jgi:hypothetical protein
MRRRAEYNTLGVINLDFTNFLYTGIGENVPELVYSLSESRFPLFRVSLTEKLN